MIENTLFIHDVRNVYVSKITDSIDDEPYGVIKLQVECEGGWFEILLFGNAEINLKLKSNLELEEV